MGSKENNDNKIVIGRNSGAYADLHVHSYNSFDGLHPIMELIDVFQRMGLSLASITDHNTIKGMTDLYDFYHKSYSSTYLQFNQLKFIPAVEVTCRVSNITNKKGNSTKIHVLVYGSNLSPNSPLYRLLGYKRRNDKDVDYGLLLHICTKKNIINLESDEDKLKFEEDIRNFVVNKRKEPEYEGFSSFGVRQALEFLQEKGWFGTFVKSHKELFELYETAPRFDRLDIEFEDLMKVIHASDYVENNQEGGDSLNLPRLAHCAVGIMAHPSVNASRTDKPEELVEYLINAGIDGFEIAGEKKKYRDIITKCVAKISSENPILYTGGSDTHDLTEGNTLGIKNNIIIGKSDVSKFEEWIENENYARQHNLQSIRKWSVGMDEVEGILLKYKQKLDTINQQAYTIMRDREDYFTQMSEATRFVWETTIPAKISAITSKKHHEKDENYSVMDSGIYHPIKPKDKKSKKKKKIKPQTIMDDEQSITIEERLANSLEYLAYIKGLEEKYSKSNSYTYDADGNVYSISEDK